MTIYLVIGETVEMPPTTASGGISRERFHLGSSNFTRLSRTSGPTNMPEMGSPAPSGRLKMLLNTTEKCANQSIV